MVFAHHEQSQGPRGIGRHIMCVGEGTDTPPWIGHRAKRHWPFYREGVWKLRDGRKHGVRVGKLRPEGRRSVGLVDSVITVGSVELA